MADATEAHALLGSVDDVECVAQGPIQLDPGHRVELSHGTVIEISFRDSDDVVAVDRTHRWEPVGLSNFDFGGDPTERAANRSTGHRVEERDSSIPGQDTDRAATCRWTQVGPNDVIAGYHSGAVSAASRLDASSSRGSGGYLLYPSINRSSA